MIAHGHFEDVEGGTPLSGSGVMEFCDGVMRIEGAAYRRGVSTVLAILISLTLVAVLTVVGMFYFFDDLSRKRLLQLIVTGVAVGGGGFFSSKKFLDTRIPRRKVAVSVPLRYFVTASAHGDHFEASCSSPHCFGRIAFCTDRAEHLAHAVNAAKMSHG